MQLLSAGASARSCSPPPMLSKRKTRSRRPLPRGGFFVRVLGKIGAEERDDRHISIIYPESLLHDAELLQQLRLAVCFCPEPGGFLLVLTLIKIEEMLHEPEGRETV